MKGGVYGVGRENAKKLYGKGGKRNVDEIAKREGRYLQM